MCLSVSLCVYVCVCVCDCVDRYLLFYHKQILEYEWRVNIHESFRLSTSDVWIFTSCSSSVWVMCEYSLVIPAEMSDVWIFMRRSGWVRVTCEYSRVIPAECEWREYSRVIPAEMSDLWIFTSCSSSVWVTCEYSRVIPAEMSDVWIFTSHSRYVNIHESFRLSTSDGWIFTSHSSCCCCCCYLTMWRSITSHDHCRPITSSTLFWRVTLYVTLGFSVRDITHIMYMTQLLVKLC